MTQRLGLAKTLRFVVIKPDSTAEAQRGPRRRREGLFWGIPCRSCRRQRVAAQGSFPAIPESTS